MPRSYVALGKTCPSLSFSFLADGKGLQSWVSALCPTLKIKINVRDGELTADGMGWVVSPWPQPQEDHRRQRE